ncbi:MAG: hypothetical protein LBR22_11430 [Desulfovibrio sp.]|jgi:hypothetical protein|nr:hypothetical protein [Desulfovibrio sp.]
MAKKKPAAKRTWLPKGTSSKKSPRGTAYHRWLQFLERNPEIQDRINKDQEEEKNKELSDTEKNMTSKES